MTSSPNSPSTASGFSSCGRWPAAGTIRNTAPGTASARPGLRFGLIDLALAPFAASLAPAAMTRLKLDLAVVVSAEAFFTLTDLCGLAPDDAKASAVRTATTLTRAAFDLYPERARVSAPRL